MNTETITVTMSVADLRLLALLAKAVADAREAACERRPIGDNGACSLHYPDNVSIDVKSLIAEHVKTLPILARGNCGHSASDIQFAARGAMRAMDYTRQCEAELCEELANVAPVPAKSAAGVHVYTRPQMVASYSVHGSFGEDHVVRQCEETARKGMAYRYIGSNRGYAGYDGRKYEITSGIFCG